MNSTGKRSIKHFVLGEKIDIDNQLRFAYTDFQREEADEDHRFTERHRDIANACDARGYI
jgi:hypothetical protein